MKIVKFTAENVKKLKAVEITPTGSVVEITGPNEAGKSSVLDAIFFAVGGLAGIPTEVVRQGEEKAFVKLDLGEIIVTRKFTANGGTTLTVEQANGARFPSPQKMLDDLVGALSFDPLEFSRMEPRFQLEALRRVVKIDLDVDALDREVAGLTEKRRDANREARGLEARVAALATSLALFKDVPTDEIDVEALVNHLDNIGLENQALEKRRSSAQANLNASKESRLKARTKLGQIEQLDKEIEVLRSRIVLHEQTKVKLNQEATEYEESANAQESVVEADIPVNYETLPTRRKIAEAQDANKRIGEAKRTREAHAILDSQLINWKIRAEELSAGIEELATKRAAAIAAAEMPVEGLAFGDGEVRYQNLPFSQASEAAKLRVSVGIAMAANPKLRVLRVRDGSLLDEKNLAALFETVASNDFQLWIERVEESRGRMSIVMEDGAVKTPSAELNSVLQGSASDEMRTNTMKDPAITGEIHGDAIVEP